MSAPEFKFGDKVMMDDDDEPYVFIHYRSSIMPSGRHALVIDEAGEGVEIAASELRYAEEPE